MFNPNFPLRPSVWDLGFPDEGNASKSENALARLDVHEDEKKIVVHCEVPGMDKEDVHVDLEDNTLTISGKKENRVEKRDDTHSYFERSYGSFKRSLTLPEGVTEKDIKGELKDGVLVVNVTKPEPPKESGRRKRIQL